MNAELLMLIGGVGAFVLTIYWVRNRTLREKYAVGWIAVATLLLLLGLFPGIIMTFADASRLSYPSAVLFIALAMIYAYAFFASVSLSRQYRRSARLAQELALLEHRLRRLEQSQAVRAGRVEPREGETVGRADSAGAGGAGE
jgi:hypothetical protein